MSANPFFWQPQSSNPSRTPQSHAKPAGLKNLTATVLLGRCCGVSLRRSTETDGQKGLLYRAAEIARPQRPAYPMPDSQPDQHALRYREGAPPFLITCLMQS
ncbi:MAG: hypothetical protein QF412_13815 [Planctomycetota bacterium]|nr:hypothetical protein [Planctomycetota bacterium]